ncbi:MarR family winged helix-turn-helix transcriptional regulator [Peterkaempfera bronchialis]|uniref:MarR family transcriptional regulator n=1 Tax=Peterkaempfera bronchialis TaxID=2126346 RepID=A0A345T4A4_9ACTN|nr:MarR family transcriptional regulator [Peterkaempfera bronchialis]AXI80809.1 MarR family transcriptional regulator [Peterkaempfera bronchialis]
MTEPRAVQTTTVEHPPQPPQGVFDPAELTRLRLAISRLNRQLTQAAGGRDLTSAQLSALARIEQHGPLRLGELAGREGVSAPSMVRTLAPLTAGGLVGKEPDPLDGRSWLMTVTPVGREMIARLRRERSAVLSRRAARLSPEQCEVLYAAIPVLELLADEALPDAPPA